MSRAMDWSIPAAGKRLKTLMPCMANLLVYKRISGQDEGAEQPSNLQPVLDCGVSDFMHG
jgi:hypothetical protein